MRPYWIIKEGVICRAQLRQVNREKIAERQMQRKAYLLFEFYRDIIKDEENNIPMSVRLQDRTRELEKIGYLKKGELTEKAKAYIIEEACKEVQKHLKKAV